MPKEFNSLADQAYELLEEKIISLQLKPGRVYSEAELSELIELGRTPMREALLRLAKERLVQMIPRRGVLISDIDLKQHIGLLATGLTLALEEARHNGATLEMTELVDRFYAEVQAMGGSRWDTSSLFARMQAVSPDSQET